MKLSYKYATVPLTVGMLRCLKCRMRWVRAAGCVVYDSEGNMLLIRRNQRWDLPKGKVEEGETLLQAALRETTEETGLDVSPVAAPSSAVPVKTYHIFNLYGGWHLKQTSWFTARCAGVRPKGHPQDDEGITAVEWVSPDEWYNRLQHSYGTLKTVSRKFTVARAH